VRKALVLAAGEGTRLRPLTLDRPKPMLPVAGKPVLEHIVNWLRYHGVEQVAINLHHKPERVIEHFGDGRRWGVAITYSIEERILGTAGGAKRLQDFLDETFVVVYGDVITDLDLAALIAYHGAGPSGERTAPRATLALYRVPNPWECGIVALDEAGRIRRFVEKPERGAVFSDLASAGVMVLEPALLDLVPPDTFFDFGHDLLPLLLAGDIPILGWPISPNDYLLDMGTMDKYRQAGTDVASGRWRPCAGPAGV
jgi:mannose-1-phosphate guanylyltransferase/phosphomannomutase